MIDNRGTRKRGRFVVWLILSGVGLAVITIAAWTVIKQRNDSRLIREIRALGGRADVDDVVYTIWNGEAGEAPRDSFVQRAGDSTSQWFQTRDQAVWQVNLQGCDVEPVWVTRLRRATDLEVLSLEDRHLGPELKALRQNTNLEWLYLSGSDVSRGLWHVSQLSQLESIAIWGDPDAPTELSSDDLASLVAMPNLKRLDLSRVSVTDQGLEQISRMKSLERLYVYSNFDSTSEGLQCLSSLGALTELSLQSLPIGDNGLSAISALSGLKSLYVCCPAEVDSSTGQQAVELPPVTDIGIENISDLSQLQSLCLESAHLSDACVEHLVKLQQLKHLTIFNSQISPQGLARLTDALPNCKIRVEEQ